MKTICHVLKTFLPVSQTFVYQQINANTRYKHVVFARKRENKNMFPLSGVFKFKDPDELVKKMCNQKVDLIHAHFGPAGVLALKAKQNLGVPMITFFHGYDAGKYLLNEQRKKDYERLFEQGELFAAPSEAIRQRLLSIGCPEKKVKVCRLGVHLEQFSYRPRFLLAGDTIRLISVGRLVEKKGHHLLIKALSIVKEKVSNFHLSIIGEGSQQDVLEKLIKRVGLKDKVTFMGRKTHAEVKDELQRSHIFCLASVTASNGNMEGLPVAILEAQAAGLPVVSTKHSGIPEGVLDGASALLAEEGNIKDLAEQLVKMMEQPDRWVSFGNAGRKWVEKHFNADKQLRRLEDLYESLID